MNPLTRQLAHPRIDHRIAGASVAPVRECVVDVPPFVARPVVAPGGVGSRHEGLVVEVTPAELPDERLGTAASREFGQDLERGDAAEVEVGADP
jgi:hypothetical protein